MSEDPTFLNLIRGNRPRGYMGLETLSNAPVVFGPDYSYIEISKFDILNGSEAVEGKLSRNQHIEFVPLVLVKPARGYKVLVTTNPRLQTVGNSPTMFLLDHGFEGRPSFFVSLRKDFDDSQLEWIVRLYLIS